jgi:2-haloacid dehalogenase
MAKYRFIFFDADRTILDFDKSEETALGFAFSKFGHEFNNEILTAYRVINHKMWTELEKGNLNSAQVAHNRFVKLFGLFRIEEDVEKFNDEYINQLSKTGFLIDGAKQVCEKLCKYAKLYIATNGTEKVQLSRLNNSGLEQYFENVFISERIGYAKPMREYFEYIFSSIEGFSKDLALMVGDSLQSDIAGAKVAGIDTCWFDRDNTGADGEATYRITKLEALLDIVL